MLSACAVAWEAFPMQYPETLVDSERRYSVAIVASGRINVVLFDGVQSSFVVTASVRFAGA